MRSKILETSLRWALILIFKQARRIGEAIHMNHRAFRFGLLVLATAIVSFFCSQVGFGETSQLRGPDMGRTEEPGTADVATGKMIYKMTCIHCHGSKGRGDGAAAIFIGPYSHPRPNDFTAGIFKFRSTESGQLPMLKDLIRTIREGIPGIMPSFRNLGGERLRQVALYVSKEFIKQELPTKTTITYIEHVGPYTYSVESVRRGKELYTRLGCAACHGVDGLGTGITLQDVRGLSIEPVDLTRQETFGNGTSHEDIYRTIMTGLDGTPMPGFSGQFKGKEDNAWDLVHYILSLQGR
jgi:cytochrome c oxidase cbb3-type subunit I/II